MTVVPIAQTNLQLLNRLGERGWSEADRLRVVAAHDLAVVLFAGAYRGSGKPFLAHLVGTAAIVAEGGGTTDETIAALLHAAYIAGDFGDGRAVTTPRKTAEVRHVVGTEAETLIEEYGEWAWRERLAELVDDGADSFSRRERSVALIRIANEIEDHLDNAPAFLPVDHWAPLSLADAAAGAVALGRPHLAQVANQVAAMNAQVEVPAVLRRTTRTRRTVTPRSTTTRLRTRVTGERSVVRRTVRKIPGARTALHTISRWHRERLGSATPPAGPDQ